MNQLKIFVEEYERMYNAENELMRKLGVKSEKLEQENLRLESMLSERNGNGEQHQPRSNNNNVNFSAFYREREQRIMSIPWIIYLENPDVGAIETTAESIDERMSLAAKTVSEAASYFVENYAGTGELGEHLKQGMANLLANNPVFTRDDGRRIYPNHKLGKVLLRYEPDEDCVRLEIKITQEG